MTDRPSTVNVELHLTIIENYMRQARDILDSPVYDAQKLRKTLNNIKKTATMAVKVSPNDQ